MDLIPRKYPFCTVDNGEIILAMQTDLTEAEIESIHGTRAISLVLHEVALTTEQLRLVLRVVGSTSIKYLDLSSTGLDDAGAAILAEALPTLNLVQIVMRKNPGITNAGWRLIYGAMSPHLRVTKTKSSPVAGLTEAVEGMHF